MNSSFQLRSRGEIALTLTILSLVIILAGTVIGTQQVVRDTVQKYFSSAQTPSCTFDSVLELHVDGHVAQNLSGFSWQNSFGARGEIPSTGDATTVWRPRPLPGEFIDKSASVTLTMPSGYEVDSIFCNDTDGRTCRGYGSSPEKKTITNLLLSCGGTVTYGWNLKQPASSPTPPLVQTGSGDMEVKIVALNYPQRTRFWDKNDIASRKPASCTRQPEGEVERPLYLSPLSITAHGPSGFSQKVSVGKNRGHLSFMGIPPGDYTLEVSGMGGRGFHLWNGCEGKTWTVTSGGTVANNRTHTKAYIVLENETTGEYETTGSESACTSTGGVSNLMQGQVGSFCYYQGGKPVEGPTAAPEEPTGVVVPTGAVSCNNTCTYSDIDRQTGKVGCFVGHCIGSPCGFNQNCQYRPECAVAPFRSPFNSGAPTSCPGVRPTSGPTSTPSTQCQREGGTCTDKSFCQTEEGRNEGIKGCQKRDEICCILNTPTARPTTMPPTGVFPITIPPTAVPPTQAPVANDCETLQAGGSIGIVFIPKGYSDINQFFDDVNKGIESLSKTNLGAARIARMNFKAYRKFDFKFGLLTLKINDFPDLAVTTIKSICGSQIPALITKSNDFKAFTDGLGPDNVIHLNSSTLSSDKDRRPLGHELGHIHWLLHESPDEQGLFSWALGRGSDPNCDTSSSCSKWDGKPYKDKIVCSRGCMSEKWYRPSVSGMMNNGATHMTTDFNDVDLDIWDQNDNQLSGFASLSDNATFHNTIRVVVNQKGVGNLSLREIGSEQSYPIDYPAVVPFNALGDYYNVNIIDNSGKVIYTGQVAHTDHPHVDTFGNGPVPTALPAQVKDQLVLYLPYFDNAKTIAFKSGDGKELLNIDLAKSGITPPVKNQNLCGNGICDARNGEDVNSCRVDCQIVDDARKKVQTMDINGDKVVNAIDFGQCIVGYGKTGNDLRCDIDKNQKTDALDLSIIIENLGRSVN